jgi:nitrogen regulatory protein PII
LDDKGVKEKVKEKGFINLTCLSAKGKGWKKKKQIIPEPLVDS